MHETRDDENERQRQRTLEKRGRVVMNAVENDWSADLQS